MVCSIDRIIRLILRSHMPSHALTIRCSAVLVCSFAICQCLLGQSPEVNNDSQARVRIGTPALTQAPDKIWIESLIDLGSADLACQVCQFRLKESIPGTNAHAQWLMLLMQAKTAQGLDRIDWNSPADSLQASLDELRSLESIQKTTDSNRRAPWIQWKELWCRRLVNQYTLAAFLSVPGRQSHQDWLLQSIRSGLDQIDSLEQVVLKMQPDKPIVSKSQREVKDKTLPNEITSAEILDLRGEIELLRADFLYQRSQCYPEGSDEQIAAATQMLTSLDRASSQLPANWTHRPLLSLARGEAELQLGRKPVVQKNMEELWNSLAEDPNPESKDWRIAAASLAIRSARLSEQWQAADAWFARVGGWEKSPELALEHLAITVARDLNRTASPESILGLRKRISDRFGRYWEQRVDAMLVSNPLIKGSDLSNSADPSSSSTMASLELFRIQARQAIAANRIETAIEKLQQAESTASKSGAVQEAFNFAMQIAALLQRMGQDSAAADEFYRTAVSYPESPKASSAAMMSAWLIRNPDSKLDAEAQQIRQSTYLQRLRETALVWPQSDSAEQAIQSLESSWLTSGDYAACLQFWSEYLSKHPGALNRSMGRLLLVALVSQEDWLEKPLQERSLLTKSREKLVQEILETVARLEQSNERPVFGVAEFQAWLAATGPERRWNVPMASDTQMQMADIDVTDLVGQLAAQWNRCEEAWQHGAVDQGMLEALDRAQKGLSQKYGSPNAFYGGRLERFIALLKVQANSKTPQELRVQLEDRIGKEPKSLWWVYRSARAMQRTDLLSDSALGWYRQMASGVAAGSEPWLEARARTIGILRSKGEVVKANELLDLLVASYPNLSDEWKARISDR